MHAPDGSCRKPAGARAPVTGGTGGHRARAPRPTAGVAAARPQANPDVGGGACPPAGIGAPPWRGAPQPGRRGPPSGAGRYAAFPRCLLGDQRTLGREAAGEECGRWPRRDQWPPAGRCAGDGQPNGWAMERLDAGGRKPRRGRALDAGAKGARASAALWQRARPPR